MSAGFAAAVVSRPAVERRRCDKIQLRCQFLCPPNSLAAPKHGGSGFGRGATVEKSAVLTLKKLFLRLDIPCFYIKISLVATRRMTQAVTAFPIISKRHTHEKS